MAGKKKRRLRLNLITSRLSQPFSAPATNIVDRGISKIAIWAKGRRLDKDVLRKAAIMNRLRLRLGPSRGMPESGEPDILLRAPRHMLLPVPEHTTLPPSPLGLSNYDALDLEDEILEEEEGEHNLPPRIYSDFNIMDPNRIVSGDDYEYLDELDGIAHELPEAMPPPPDERLLEMIEEKERQKEISFVRFIA